jgi:serine/threonine-protein kinase
MESVHLAWDRAAGRPCAVKVLSDVLSRDEEFRRRFRREAEAAQRLTHPHIVTVYGCGEDGVHHYMVMEYVPGGTLRDALRHRGALGEAEALRVASEVADALAYAHGRGVVHRDIKPHNVLLTEEGHVKVADFGIARTLDATSLTRTGSVFGSAQYISPEQARGDHAGPQADLYALGVVLFEMLTGRVPFDGEAPVAVALKHLKDPPPDLFLLRPDLSAATVVLIQRLLAKAEEDRPPTAAALAADLRGIASTIVSDSPVPRPFPRASGMADDVQHATAVLTPHPASLGDPPAPTAQLPVPPGAREEAPPPAAAGFLPGTMVDDTSKLAVPARRRDPGPVSSRAAALVLAGALAVGLVGGAYRATWVASHATVPRLVGQTIADAAKAVASLRLGIVVASGRQDPGVAPGVVLAQDPPPGQGSLTGSVIRVTVS